MGPMIVLHDKFDHSPIYTAPETIIRVQKHGPRHSLVTCSDGRQIEVCEAAKLIWQKRDLALGYEASEAIGNQREANL